MATTTTTTTNRPPVGHAPGETRSQTLHRMLLKAREQELKIYRVAGTVDTYAAVSTGRRGVYIVRPGVRSAGCTCEGYRRHGYCKHYAAACSAHGLLTDPEPDPSGPAAAGTPAPRVICPDCKGDAAELTPRGICKACEDYYLDLAYEEQREYEDFLEDVA